MNISFSLNNLHILVDQNPVIKGVDLAVSKGSVCALLGPNGSGKSSLVNAIAGHPLYTIAKGSILIDGEDICRCSPDVRSRKGIFVSFQQVPVIPGVTVFSFLKEAYPSFSGSTIDVGEFRSLVGEYADLLGIDSSFLGRCLFQGFSGGEKKRIEMLQLLLFKPKIALLDEVDSGVDVDSRQRIIDCIELARKKNPSMSIMFITHYQHLIDEIKPDFVHIMKEGKIIRSGNCSFGAEAIKRGYQEL